MPASSRDSTPAARIPAKPISDRLVLAPRTRLTDDLSALLFALATEDRLTLLAEVSRQKQRLTALSRVIQASAQECSRHLTRLTNSGLIRRDSSGLFEPTPLGKSVLSFLPGIRFLSKQKSYFLAHDLSSLPPSFVERIGELGGGVYVNHVSQVLDHIKRTISEAKEYVWLIADQPIVPGPSIGSSFPSKTIAVRLITEQPIRREDLAEARPGLPERIELATSPDVRIAMAINERIAGVCFPGLDGQIDFGAGFAGTGSEFLTWCNDLFGQYWAKSRKLALV